MKTATKNFLKLIFEKKENDKQDAEKEDTTSSIRVFNVTTSNKIAKGRPLRDPGLTNIRHRAEAGAAEASSLLKDIGIGQITGRKWYDQIQDLYSTASRGKMRELIDAASVVKSPTNIVGVLLSLDPQWSDDEKNGKRSYGFLRSLLIAAIKSGQVEIKASQSRKLRIEIVEGANQAIIYVGGANSWNR
tara:strand:- start:2249 stop:2815 length:567 start_codon:yes stop_codon:yes gene_type:complete